MVKHFSKSLPDEQKVKYVFSFKQKQILSHNIKGCDHMTLSVIMSHASSYQCSDTDLNIQMSPAKAGTPTWAIGQGQHE